MKKLTNNNDTRNVAMLSQLAGMLDYSLSALPRECSSLGSPALSAARRYCT